jgi:RNA polymerase sigma-70 factor (ECF subfamily)
MDAGDAEVILVRARAGDEDAFRLLVDRHARQAFNLAYRLTRDERDAEDVVQESFVRAFRGLDGFEARANFGTWLYRIVVNCATDLLRSRRHGGDEVVPDEAAVAEMPANGPSPERLARSSEIQRRVDASMATLTPQERVAFALRHYEGRSIEEIGRTLRIQNSAAKHAVFRAVRKVRAALEPLRRET